MKGAKIVKNLKAKGKVFYVGEEGKEKIEGRGGALSGVTNLSEKRAPRRARRCIDSRHTEPQPRMKARQEVQELLLSTPPKTGRRKRKTLTSRRQQRRRQRCQQRTAAYLTHHRDRNVGRHHLYNDRYLSRVWRSGVFNVE